MAKTAKEAAAAFLAEILAKLPAELQGKAKEVFDHADASAALDLVGQGALRQSDYSRMANDLQTKERELATWHEELNGWYTENQALIAKGKTAPVGTPNPSPSPTPTPTPTDTLTKAEFDRTLADTERGAVAFFSQLNGLSLEHYKNFGEILDTDTLLADKRIAQMGLKGVYQEVHKDKLQARADAARTAAEEAIRKDERIKVQTELASRQLPQYPGSRPAPSTLDAIEAATRTPNNQPPVVKSLDEISAEYARLGQARAGLA